MGMQKGKYFYAHHIQAVECRAVMDYKKVAKLNASKCKTLKKCLYKTGKQLDWIVFHDVQGVCGSWKETLESAVVI